MVSKSAKDKHASDCCGVHGDLSLIIDGFICKRCDGTIQEADLAEDLVIPRKSRHSCAGYHKNSLRIFTFNFVRRTASGLLDKMA